MNAYTGAFEKDHKLGESQFSEKIDIYLNTNYVFPEQRGLKIPPYLELMGLSGNKLLKNQIRNDFNKSGLSRADYVSLTIEAIFGDAPSAPVLNSDARLAEMFASAIAQPAIPLPKAAPELYQNRKRPESPIAFYDRVWRQYESSGLYQDTLRHFDSKLIPAIHTYCSRRNLNPKEHLPPPRQVRAKREVHAKVFAELQAEGVNLPIIAPVSDSAMSSQFAGVASKPALKLPDIAPELYVGNRGGGSKGENIIDFLRRVWMPWIEAGMLTRPDLKRLDRGAYVGLNNWVKTKKYLPADINIPTKSEAISRALEGFLPEMLRAQRNLAAAALARQARVVKP